MKNDKLIQLLVNILQENDNNSDKNENYNNFEKSYIGQHVIVRTYSAGVFVGVVKNIHEDKIILDESRRIWKWEGAFTLSEISEYGLDSKKSRMSCKKNDHYIPKFIEIVPTTRKARETFDNCNESNER